MFVRCLNNCLTFSLPIYTKLGSQHPMTLFVHPAYVRCVYICVTVLMKQLLVYSAKNTITKSNPASPIYLELFHTFKCILLAIQYSQNHSKKINK